MLIGEEKKRGYSFSGMLSWIIDNIVTIIFVLFVLFGFMVSKGIPLSFFLSELCDRIFRNSFLVISLIIPVLAGLGLNFGIVIGAMSGQAAVALARYHGMGGVSGLLFCVVVSGILAALCGYFTGRLYNKTRGQEMIASLIVGYFANGIYQFIFLFVVGVIIAVDVANPIIKPDGVGINMTVDLVPVENGGLKYALENIYKIPFVQALLIVSLAILAVLLIGYYLNKRRGEGYKNHPLELCFNALLCVAAAGIAIYVIVVTPKIYTDLNSISLKFESISSNLAATPASDAAGINAEAVASEVGAIAEQLKAAASGTGADIETKVNSIVSELEMITSNPSLITTQVRAVSGLLSVAAVDTNTLAEITCPNELVANMMSVRTVPVVTGILIICLCIFTVMIMKTKLGQDFRAVGQNQHISEVSGINVDRTRIIATIISTVLAAWGQLIFLQSMGTLSTYSAHTQIGMFSVAALLVGGASTSRASIKNAIFGTLLFNAMFIMSPEIGLSLFGQAVLGEYFRTFMVYGVIGVALGLYVWKANKRSKIVVE